MKPLAAVFLVLALAACAEVTKFQKSDGTAYYYVDCENTLRILETCSFAARRTCPGGYSPAKVITAQSSADDRQYARCIEDNRERDDNGTPQIACLKAKRNEGYFTCN